MYKVFENLYLLKKDTKNQEASYNFKLGFAFSNRPHLHRAYVVSLFFLNVFVLDDFHKLLGGKQTFENQTNFD